jgi:hypothetical protein
MWSTEVRAGFEYQSGISENYWSHLIFLGPWTEASVVEFSPAKRPLQGGRFAFDVAMRGTRSDRRVRVALKREAWLVWALLF